MSWLNNPLKMQIEGASPEIDYSDHDQAELTRELWGRPETLVLALAGEKAMFDADGRLALMQPAQIDAAFGETFVLSQTVLYLGRSRFEEGLPGDGLSVVSGREGLDRVPILAILLEADQQSGLTLGQWRALRDAAAELDALDTGLLTRAVALANWHRASGFSPSTGNPTELVKSGWARIDSATGGEHFPRTDPAVIVAVTDSEDRLLLASNTAWNNKIFSLIAGFVDPGESLEQAVIREVYEEAGVRVSDPKYLGSQPWPFPSSLMLGFAAQAVDSRSQKPDGVEIRALRWFTRIELLEAVAASEVLIPGHTSISRAIIDAWLEG